MCDVLHVSETGYYRFKRNLGNPSKDAVLSAVMQEILDEYIYNDMRGQRLPAGTQTMQRLR